MHRSRLLIVTTSLAASLTLAVALSQWLRARDAIAERQRQDALHARLTAEAATLTQDIVRLPHTRKGVPPSSSSVADAANPEPPTPQSSFDLGTGGEMAELIAEHPEWRDAQQAAERADFLLDYGPLIHALGLDATPSDRFLAELSLREKKRAAIRITAHRQGWAEDAPQLLSLQEEEGARVIHDFSSLLGARGYGSFQEFERTLGVRYHINNLAANLYATSAPLNAETAERLVQAMARHATNTAGKIEFNSVRWEECLLAARDILTPEQLALFARMGKAQQQQRQLNRIVATSRPPDTAP